jgi:hypothetical protein
LSSTWLLLNVGRAFNSNRHLQLQAEDSFQVCADAVGVNPTDAVGLTIFSS